ncbi:uncharacterized [Tachysurus ichikawai]
MEFEKEKVEKGVCTHVCLPLFLCYCPPPPNPPPYSSAVSVSPYLPMSQARSVSLHSRHMPSIPEAPRCTVVGHSPRFSGPGERIAHIHPGAGLTGGEGGGK